MRWLDDRKSAGIRPFQFIAMKQSNKGTVSSQTIGNMGKVLVVKGKAVYTLSPAGSKCTGACLKIWPAVTETAKTVKAGSGVQQSKLGVSAGGGGGGRGTCGGAPQLQAKKTVKRTARDAMAFIIRRLVFYVVAAWVALTINFFIPRLVPGNAVEAIMSKFPNLQPSAYRALEALLGVGH